MATFALPLNVPLLSQYWHILHTGCLSFISHCLFQFLGFETISISHVRMSWRLWDLVSLSVCLSLSLCLSVSLSLSLSPFLSLNGLEKRLSCLCLNLTKSNSFKMEINAAPSLSMTFPLHIGNSDKWLCQLYDQDADELDHNCCDNGNDCVCDCSSWKRHHLSTAPLTLRPKALSRRGNEEIQQAEIRPRNSAKRNCKTAGWWSMKRSCCGFKSSVTIRCM